MNEYDELICCLHSSVSVQRRRLLRRQRWQHRWPFSIFLLKITHSYFNLKIPNHWVMVMPMLCIQRSICIYFIVCSFQIFDSIFQAQFRIYPINIAHNAHAHPRMIHQLGKYPNYFSFLNQETLTNFTSHIRCIKLSIMIVYK